MRPGGWMDARLPVVRIAASLIPLIMNDSSQNRSPDAEVNLVDHGFMDARAKLIDIAAFLDRLDRHAQGGGDYRVDALRRAMGELSSGGPDRARRVLEVLSDPTVEPIPSATIQGAAGAWAGDSSRTGVQNEGGGT